MLLQIKNKNKNKNLGGVLFQVGAPSMGRFWDFDISCKDLITNMNQMSKVQQGT